MKEMDLEIKDGILIKYKGNSKRVIILVDSVNYTFICATVWEKYIMVGREMNAFYRSPW